MTQVPTLTTHISRSLHKPPIDESLALVFPGQGSQHVGMGCDLYQTSPAARDLFVLADAILELPLSRLCFHGPEEELRQTANAQPAIMVISLACLAAALEAGALNRRPALLAGHSLGEYTALVAAGALAFEDALRLVVERGRLMQEAGTARPGAMAAVLDLGEKQVEEICRLSGAEPCNYNSPSQVVVGGPPSAVERASALARERGGRASVLNVSVAAHTSLMQSAAGEFARAVDRVPLGEPAIPVVGNVTARPLTNAEDVRTELKQQMVSPVLWQQSVAAMLEASVRTFVEVGPGRVLSSLLKRSAPGASAISIDGTGAFSSLSNV